MPSETFARLYDYGTELYHSIKGVDKIPPEKMFEIDSLITTCRQSMRTDEEKSIVSRSQDFWDACFRKWYSNNPEELEQNLEKPEKETQVQPPGRFDKVRMFTGLVNVVRALKSDKGLINTTPRDFELLTKLIEQCTSMANTRTERKMIKNAQDTYRTQLEKWQKLQQEKKSEPKEHTPLKYNYDSDITAHDLKILTKHHQVITEWKRGNKENNKKE